LKSKYEFPTTPNRTGVPLFPTSLPVIVLRRISPPTWTHKTQIELAQATRNDKIQPSPKPRRGDCEFSVVASDVYLCLSFQNENINNGARGRVCSAWRHNDSHARTLNIKSTADALINAANVYQKWQQPRKVPTRQTALSLIWRPDKDGLAIYGDWSHSTPRFERCQWLEGTFQTIQPIILRIKPLHQLTHNKQ